MIAVHSDVAGALLTIHIRGQELLLTRAEAQQLADYITHSLIRLHQDDIAKRQLDKLTAEYRV